MNEMIETEESLQDIIPPPSRIAVLRLGTLGDALLTTPLYAALKQTYPQARLTVIASEWNSVIPANHSAVDEVIAVPSGVKSLLRWLRILGTGRFDLYIDPKDHRSTTSRIVAELIRAKTRLVSIGNLPLLSGAEIVPPPSGVHFVDSALAPMLIVSPDQEFESRPSITIPDRAIEAIKKQLGKDETPFIVVNVSAGSQTRRWTEEKWKTFVQRVEWSGRIVVISSPADASLGESVAAVRPEARYLPTGSLMEAAALVDGSNGLITSDTSIVHIASALNIPIVALYFRAPRMLKKFAPLSDIQQVLIAPGEEPVAVIAVEDVLAGTREIIGRE